MNQSEDDLHITACLKRRLQLLFDFRNDTQLHVIPWIFSYMHYSCLR
jgi:hypothetical protein